jgi:hypothetical protein
VVLDRLQELRAELRCKTHPLAQYDIASLLAAKSKNTSGTKTSGQQAGTPGFKASAATVAAAPASASAGPPRPKGVVRTASDVGPHRVGQANQAAQMARGLSQQQQQQQLAHGADEALKPNTAPSPNHSKSMSKVCLASGSLPQVEQNCSSALPSSTPLQGVRAGWEGDSCANTADLRNLDATREADGTDYEPYYEGEKSFYLEHSASTTDGQFGMYGEMMVMHAMETETEDGCSEASGHQQQNAGEGTPEAAGSCPYRRP